MTHTISGTYTTLVSLTVAAYNPTTITSTGLLSDGLSVSFPGLAVVNAGSIAGNATNGDGIYLHAGGSVTNQSGGAISGYDGIYGLNAAVTVVNAGSIAANTTNGDGIYLHAGGSVTNQSGGAISGYQGIKSGTAAATVVNAGSITVAGIGVELVEGGSITNQSGGSISGFYGVAGGLVAVTVVNAGRIAGTEKGIVLLRGGRITNQSGGLITGDDGIAGYGGASTVVNAGTISGSIDDAVQFAAGFANRLIIDPGAVFSGLVTGGNTIGATVVSTLELASAGSAGTLSRLGTKYVDFAQVTVDAGARWTLTGANILAAGATLTNAGTLIDAGTLTNAGAFSGELTLAAGGVLSNASTGTVTASGGTAIDGTAAGAATVVNAGVIASSNASGGEGIDLTAGGSVTDQSRGAISGYNGIYAQTFAATVVNAGSIAGINVGVYVRAGGRVTNQSGGMISGGNFGILAKYAAVTVVNAGTIAGDNDDAVQFAAGFANRLIADPGAVFTGNVYGGGGVLELASAASAGTLSGFGTSITNFSTLQFDAGAAWTVSGTGSASGLGTIAIAGFANGDTIDLTGFVARSETFSNNTLVLTDAGGAQDTLSIQGAFTSGSFHLSTDASGTGTDVVVCFCAGTMIGTPGGEVPVEKLNIGDLVLTAQNGPRPVTWIGNGKVLATRGRRSAATPVIVRKGALADNVPKADLRVTKAHSLYIDDVLIPVEFLVNHRTILWDDRAQEVDIYHVELDSHDVLIANGAPAESYRDDGNRWLFQNANEGWHLPPQDPYAPVLTGGPIVDAIWQRLLDRAPTRPNPPLTEDSDLHLLVDGARLDPTGQHGTAHIFRLASRPHSVRIVSRAASPAELGLTRDPRRLGVAVTRITLDKGRRLRVMEASDATLTDGFHDCEPALGLRWTDGDAALPEELFEDFDGAMTLILHLGGSTRYPAFAHGDLHRRERAA